MHEQKVDYDLEPVKYCAKCYSLKIRYEEAVDSECCMDCGCSDTLTTSIDNWEKLYEGRYGHKYVVKSNNPKNSPLFKLPLSKLKIKLYDCPEWFTIIRKLYPDFPRGLGKVDSIILLFDKIYRDNKLDDLRLLMLDYYKN
jgi:hypothetical protein